MNWYYNGKEINDEFIPPEGVVGFVYWIHRMESKHHKEMADRGIGCSGNYNKIYIGKKQLSMATKKKVGKRESARQLAETGDKRKVKKVIRGSKVSNWLTYTGSCKQLTIDIKEQPELFRKEILEFAYTKKELSYLETKYQILHDVLNTDSYNDHIQNWYRKDFIKPTKTEQNDI